ncbi:MAG TPA: LytS/YhcK type 5TM receptor domain-containing protein [Patescibacteria group bacterium]|nr:LytS/YhcK type 5TM receptor domain-containing protein [Patescibacteria group bacterium]
MTEATLVGLIENTALLLAMVLVYDIALNPERFRFARVQHVAIGVIIGAIGLVVMLRPIDYIPGIVFDTRSVLLGVAGLFFGAVPTAVAMAMTAALRLADGGAGAWTGVSVILASGSIGIAWRHLRARRLEDLSPREAYLFGLVIHVVMLALMFTLPGAAAVEVIGAIGLPVIVIYPVATALLATFMVNRLRRERVRSALEESEERLRLAVKAADLGLYDANLQTGKATVDPHCAHMLGYDPADFDAAFAAVIERTHPDDREAVVAAYQDHVAGKLPLFRVESRQLTRSGDWSWILTLGRVVERDAKGAPLRMVGAILDISERVLAEAEIRRLNEELEQRVRERTADLQAANRDLEAFSYTVSHDLRTPLRAINGFASILGRRYRAVLDEKGRHYVDTIVDSSERLGILIEELLEYSRMGRQTARAEPTPLGPLMARLRATFGPRIAAAKATVEVTEPLAVPLADPTLLEQILANLVENALTYHRPGVPPRVTLSATRHGRKVTLAVADNGVGIPEEYHERIFEVFTRLQGGDGHPGTGIGLAIVRRAAHRMNSEVTLVSSAGEGSTFSLELPAADQRRTQP